MELTQGRMGDMLKKFWIKPSQSEPYLPWQVRAELCIREIKKAVRMSLDRTQAPRRLWDYCTRYQSEIRNLTAHPIFKLEGRTPYEIVCGRTPDISEYLDYAWYETVWYYDQEANFPEPRRKMAKWLGVAHRVGQALCYYVLPSSGRPIVRSTVQPLTHEEKESQEILQQIKELDQSITSSVSTLPQQPLLQELQDVDVNDIAYKPYLPMEPEAEKPDADEFTPTECDQLIAAEVLIPKDDVLQPATVISRKRDESGNPIGRSHINPMLDTRVYNVQFNDRHIEEYAANTIAENIYSQLDTNGERYLVFQEIIDHIKDDTAIQLKDKYIHHGSNKTLRHTTKGWFLQILWKDGSTSWEPLRNLKESNPVQVAEYAVANKIEDEAAFAWWVPYTLRKRDRIISSVKCHNVKRNNKFGIEVLRSIERALEIDMETKTDYWLKAIEKEMSQVKIAFTVLDEGAPEPVGSKRIPCHIIFDVKMDFTRKARFVAGGHVTDPPSSLTYSSVVSRDSVRLAFLIAALNDPDVLVADVGNAYLNAPTQEKVHTICGREFGNALIGRVAIICRALYGLKSSGAAWRNLLAGTLHDEGFVATLLDPDVWMRANTKRNGEEYYEYIFVYVDDLLVLSEKPDLILRSIGNINRLKENSISKPMSYLGAVIKEHHLPDNPGKPIYSMSADKYVKEALRTVEKQLLDECLKLPNNAHAPLPTSYRPELDFTPHLDADHMNWYQQLIGILCWSVELGRIDIHLSVALMAQYLAQPRVGHLQQVFHIFAYLKAHSRSRILLDDSEPQVDNSQFTQADWYNFYPDATEFIPPNAPKPRGNPILISCFVDADHAGNRVTCRSHTGILIFCNRALIIWFSK
jgi:hypothetical protein